MSNQTWQLSETVMRSTLVVPTHGFGMGEVCPQAAGYATGSLATVKRHRDAITATPGSLQPWSPPVT